MLNPFSKKNRKPKQLYFALVVADHPTEGFKFTSDSDCTMFMVTGEVEKRVVIPQMVLKEVVERFIPKDKKENEPVPSG